MAAEAARPPRVAEIARNGVLKGAELEIEQKTMDVCMNSNKKNPVIKPPLTSS